MKKSEDKFLWRPNFLLGKTISPVLQPWQIELNQFKREHQPLLLGWPNLDPEYLKFKKTLADKIALSIRPVLFGFFLILGILLIAFYNLHSVAWWFGVVLVAPWLLVCSIKTIKQIYYEKKIRDHINEIPDHIAAQTREGVPGAGKTSSLLHDLKILADIMWDKICKKYRMLEPYLEEIPYWKQKQREDAEEIIEAYNFYLDIGTYPCFWTSVPCFVDGVPTNRVTADHLMQRKRLPYGAVVMLDETSLILPQELFRDKPYEILELCKFLRHFGDFKVGSTEQDENSNLIYLRRVSGRTLTMLEQEWIEQPRILQWIYDKLLSWTKTMTKKKVCFFKVFEEIIRAMGYRRYWYYESTIGVSSNPGIQSFLLKPNLNISYDDRAYKNAYRCKDEPLIQCSWEHMRLTKEEIDEIFLQELKERGKTQAQIKREARESRLKKKATQQKAA